MTRSTGPVGSPHSNPTLSHGSASRDGANCSSQAVTSATVVMVSSLPPASHGKISLQSCRVTGPGAGSSRSISRAIGSIPRTEFVMKRLIGGADPFARQRLFIDFDAQSPGSFQDDRAHHAGQQGAVEVGCDQAPALDEEDIGPARLADESLGSQARVRRRSQSLPPGHGQSACASS